MSSRIFQNVIIQMRDALDRPVGVIDDQGFVVASSELAIIGSHLDDFHLYEVENGAQPYATANRTYLPLASASGRVEFVTFAEGADQTAKMICTMASVAFNEVKGFLCCGIVGNVVDEHLIAHLMEFDAYCAANSAASASY